MVRVLVVDDHDFFRGTVVELVNGTDDLVAVGECDDGAAVAGAVADLAPDVVLMDVRMPHRSGLEAAGDLQRAGASARVIILSSEPPAGHRAEAEASGAVGYVVKGGDVSRLLDAVRHVGRGGTAWPEDLATGSPLGA
jgi:DNA-binding NarL/FixJ family response regulator